MLTIGQLVKNNGRTWKTHEAYVDGKRRVTWGEFQDRTDALGHALLQHGIKAGDRVAMIASDCIEIAELFVACAKIGAVRVGINHRLSPREMRHILDDSGAVLIFVHSRYSDILDKAASGGRKEEVAVIGFGGEHKYQEDYEEWIEQGNKMGELTYRPQEMLMICYTTGSTGMPKGAIYTHRNTIESILRIANYEGLTHDDIWLHTMPAGGVPIIHMCRNLYHAFTSVILGDFHPVKALQLIEREKVTTGVFVPTMLTSMINSSEIGKYDVSSMRQLGYGSSPLPPTVIRRAMEIFNCSFLQMYGTTEITGMASMLFPSDHRRGLEDRPEILASAGKALSFCEAKVVDDNGAELLAGETGELMVKSDLLIPGYINQQEEYEKTVKDGWLRTGDFAYMDEEGYIYLVDRAKFRIKTGGYNVFPVEVENVLAEHPSVKEVSVVGLPNEKWGDQIHAVIVLKDDQATTEEELKAFCRDKIASFKIPKTIDFWSDIPKGATGKIQKREIIEYYAKKESMSP